MHLRFSTDIRSGEFAAVFGRFEDAMGANRWRKRANKIREDMRGNPYLRQWLLEENRIAFVLDGYSRGKAASGVLPPVQIQDPAQYEAVAFVSQTVTFLDSVDAQTAHAFVGRVRGAFENPDDFRGLALEMLAGVHLQRRGASMQIPHDGTYDWLAQQGDLAFEIECKSISVNKGRQVHLRGALDLCHLAKRQIGTLDSMEDGLLVTIQLPGKVPGGHQVRVEIAKLARRSVVMNQNVQSDLATITLEHFNQSTLALTEDPADQDRLNAFLQQRYGIAHAHYTVAHRTKAGGLVLIAVGSQLPDDMIGEAMRTIQRAAADQLSGTRPGVVCVKFEAITADELLEVARQADPPSALRVGVHSVWQPSSMDRVSHIVFMADGNVEQRESGGWSRVGASYVFSNPQSPFKDDPRLQLFDDLRAP